MRSFLGFGQKNYRGKPLTQAIKLGGIDGVIIPLVVNWLAYGASTSVPNVNVAVDFDSASCRAMDQIKSIYIDNLGSDVPVYVYFPDTSYTVAAQPNSEGWYPAFTNAKKCSIIGEGFLTGDIPTTLVMLCNLPLPPSVNVELSPSVTLWRASPVISRGNNIYNSTFGAPALGDQFWASQTIDMSVIGANQNMWGTPYSSGFLYVTFLTIRPTVHNIPPTLASQCNIVIESTGIAGQLLFFPFISPASAAAVAIQSMDVVGAQIKLDATQTWRIRCAAPCENGSAQCLSTFTQQP